MHIECPNMVRPAHINIQANTLQKTRSTGANFELTCLPLPLGLSFLLSSWACSTSELLFSISALLVLCGLTFFADLIRFTEVLLQSRFSAFLVHVGGPNMAKANLRKAGLPF